MRNRRVVFGPALGLDGSTISRSPLIDKRAVNRMTATRGRQDHISPFEQLRTVRR